MKSVITPSQLWLLGENCPHIKAPINPQGNKLASFIVSFYNLYKAFCPIQKLNVAEPHCATQSFNG